MKRTPKIVPFLIMFLLTAPSLCQGQQDSPIAVVELFSASYGGPQMDEIADYTTGRFRDNRPKSVWIADTWKALHDIKYRRLYGSVIDSKVKDNKAAVILDSKIGTSIGETEQKEIYHLIKEGQTWLIDQLQVTDEDISVEKMRL
jgi:hypothetical protein